MLMCFNRQPVFVLYYIYPTSLNYKGIDDFFIISLAELATKKGIQKFNECFVA